MSSGSGDRVKTATQDITVTVTDVNESPYPVGAISAITLNEDGNAASVDVLAYFSDPDGDALSYTASSDKSSIATASVSGSTVTVSPVDAGSATVTVTASDGSLSATQTIDVTVMANSAPAFSGSTTTVSVAENTASVTTVSASDSEDSVTGYVIGGAADSGKFSIVSSSGALSFTTAPNYESPGSSKGTNTYLVSVEVSSGSGDRAKTATQDITVTVTDVNETPEAVGAISAITLNEDGNSASVDVLSNFSDPDGDTLSYTASSSAASVTGASVSGSTVTVSPIAAGSASVTVTASDGSLSATQTIAVTVMPNTAPAFTSSASVSVAENTTAVITVTASDSEDSINGYVINGGADSGKFSIGSSSGALSFNAAPSYENPDSSKGTNVYAVTVQVSSGSGDRVKSATQDISVTVTDVNESPYPIGSIPAMTLNEDGNSASVDVLAYFTDPDGDALSYTVSSSDTAKATASVSSSTVTIAPVSAGSATVTVTASDGSLTATQTIAVTVMANTAPAFGSPASVSVAENTTAVTTVTASDSEDSITSYSISGGADSGKFSIDSSTGALSFNSAPNYESPGSSKGTNTYLVSVEVSSGSGDRAKTATQDITVTVTDVNETPYPVGAISAITLNEDGNSGSVDVLAYFADPDGDTLSYTASSSATSVAGASVSGSTVTVSPVDAGSATVTVTASDGSLSAAQTIAVTVMPNTAPAFGSSTTVSIPENTASVITVTASDSEDSITSYSIDSGADSGKFSIDSSTGALSFTTAPNYESPGSANGTNVYAVTVQVSSGSGDRVKTATQDITVTVTDVNESPYPVGAISAITLNEDGSSDSVDVLGYFSDPDGDALNYTASSDKSSIATASVSGSTVTVSPVDAGSATVTVTASDGNLSATQTIAVTVMANTAPAFSSSASVSIAENTASVITVTASDSEDSVTGYVIGGGADSGKFSIGSSSGALSFTTAPNYESPGSSKGTNVYVVTVQVSSGSGDRVKTATQDISVTVTDVNESPYPIGAISAMTLNEGGNAASLDVLAYFADPDGDSLSYTASSSAASVAGASVSGSTVTVSPVDAGSATVTVTASDGSLSAAQTIAVTVMANTAPAFGSSTTVSVPENTASVITVTASDSEDSITSYSIDSGADSGKFSIDSSTGALSFTTAPNYESPGSSKGTNVYAVTVQVSSGSGDRVKTATQNITVTVTDVNETPEAVGSISAITLNEDGNSASVDVLAYFSDPDGDTLSYTASSSATSVAGASVSGSTVTVSPVDAGTATVTVTASDGSLSAAQTIAVTVKANTAPAFTSSASVSVAENTTAVTTVSATDSEDSITSYSIDSGADSGKFSIGSSTGALSFNSAPNYESPGSSKGTNVYVVTVQVSSGGGDRVKTATQDISVTVTDVNESPQVTATMSSIVLNVGGAAFTTDVSAHFSDPDGDALTYTASASDESMAAVNLSDSTLTISPVAAGQPTVTVTATDPGGLSAAYVIGVTVNANAMSRFTGLTSFSVPENTTAVGTVTATDNDGGDSVTGYSIGGGADSAKFSIDSATGDLSFNAAPDYENPLSSESTNVYALTVQAESGAGDRANTATQDITVTVVDANEAPEASGSISNVTLNVGGNSRAVDVGSAFTDPDGDALTFTASSANTSAAGVSVSGSAVKISPIAAGSATVTVTATDPGGLSAVRTIAVTVTGNSAPTFGSPATVSVPENTTAVITVTAIDSDDSVTGYTITGGADRGQFSINTSSGVLIFNTAPNYEAPTDAAGNNDYIVDVQASSGVGDRAKTATQTLTVTVTDENEAPVASGSISDVTLNVDGNSRTVDVGSAFTDPDGDALTFTASSANASAAGVSVSGSAVKISPIAAGSATVTVTATDPGGLSAVRTIAVTVQANSAPTFGSSATVSVPENTTAVITVTAADSDDSVTGYTITGGADAAKFSIGSSSGDLRFNAVPNYEAPTDAAGNNDYIVDVQASSGGADRAKTATQTLTVTVTDVNEAPVASGVIAGVTVNVGGNSRTVDVGSAFTDPDGDVLTFTASSANTSVAAVSVSGSAVTISPVAAGNAAVTVTATDSGGLSAAQTIAVTVQGNAAPTFGSSATVSVPENTTAVITVTAADSDDSVTGYTITGGADAAKFSIGSSSGDLRFNAAPNYEAPTDAAGNNDYSVDVQASSGSGDRAKTTTQSLKVTVTDVNEAPIAVGTVSGVGLNAGGSAADFDVSSNFIDPDGDALSYSVSSSNSVAATVSLANATLTITPLIAGATTVTVNATDPGGLSAAQTIAVSVDSNDGSRFSGVTRFSVPENAIAVGTVTATDNDSGDAITGYAITGGADGAKFAIESSTGALSFNAPPDYEAPTDASRNNDYIVEVQVSSGTGDRAKTAAQSFTVTVTDVNEAPLAVGSIPSFALNVGGADGVVDVSGYFTDPDGDALTYTASSNNFAVATLSVSSSTVTIAPAASGNAALTVTASDPHGLSAVQTIAVVVDGNAPPTFNPPVKFSVPENTTNVGTLTASDTDSGDSVTGYAIAGGADGTLFSIVSSSGVLSFNTAPNYEAPTDASGNNDYIVEVQVSSGTGDRAKTASQSYTVTVTDVNEAPLAVGSIPSLALNVGGANGVVDVSANFTDPDGDVLSYSASSNKTGVATVGVSGSTVTVTPVATGSATVTVTAGDPRGLTATQTIIVTVAPAVNRAPTTVGSIDAVQLTVGGASHTVDVSTKFSDPDGDSLGFTAVSSDTARASAGVTGSSVTISPAAVGSATVTVTASDPDGLTATQSISVTVSPPRNQPPVVATPIDPITIEESGSSVTVDVADNFSDPEGGDLTYTVETSDATVATVSVSGGTLTIASVDQGTAAITVTAADSDGLETAHAFNVTVNSPPNRAPVTDWLISSITLDGEESTSVDLSESFSDPDGDDLTYTVESSDTGAATVSVAGDTLTITAAGVGMTTITLTATDPDGLTSTQTFTVTVKPPPNRAPVVNERIDSVTMREGQSSVTVDLSEKFSDPDDDDLAFTAASSNTQAVTLSLSEDVLTIAAEEIGSAAVTVTATDADGLTSTQTFTVTVSEAPNEAPELVGLIEPITLSAERPSVTVNAVDRFIDPEGGHLTFTAMSSDTDAATADVSGDLVTITAADVGATTIIVAATDSKGLTTRTKINVTVIGLDALPFRTELLPNYPSPFNPETWIPYRLAEDANVTLTVYDVRGNAVRTFAIGHREAGAYVTPDKAVYWDGANNNGETVSAGVYFYNLTTEKYTGTRRTSILK